MSVRGFASTALIPRSIEEATKFAEVLAKSSAVPNIFRNKPDDVLIAIMSGLEWGIPPIQALRSIFVVNGRPSLWGDAMLGLALSHPAYLNHREWFQGEGDSFAAYCECTRSGKETVVLYSVSVADARVAGLWDKDLWKKYPRRMLQMKARAFCLRDTFADALSGIYTYEEVSEFTQVDEGAFNKDNGYETEHPLELIEAEPEISDAGARYIEMILNAPTVEALMALMEQRHTIPEHEQVHARDEWLKRKEQLENPPPAKQAAWSMADEFPNEVPKREVPKQPWAN